MSRRLRHNQLAGVGNRKAQRPDLMSAARHDDPELDLHAPHPLTNASSNDNASFARSERARDDPRRRQSARRMRRAPDVDRGELDLMRRGAACVQPPPATVATSIDYRHNQPPDRAAIPSSPTASKLSRSRDAQLARMNRRRHMHVRCERHPAYREHNGNRHDHGEHTHYQNNAFLPNLSSYIETRPS